MGAFWDRVLGRGPVLDAALTLAQEATGPAFSHVIDFGPNGIDPALFGMTQAEGYVPIAGRISRREAIQVPAVKRARDLICGTLGTIPLKVYDTDNVTLVNELLDQPEKDVAPVVTYTKTAEDLLYEACAYWRVTEWRFDNYPKHVRYIEHYRVSEQADGIYIDGARVDPHPKRPTIIKFTSPNDPLLEAGARAIRTLARLEAAVANYADEPSQGQYFKTKEGAPEPTKEEKTALLNAWRAARKARSTGYVPEDVELHADAYFSPEQLQMSDQVRGAIVEIANATGLTSEMLNVSTTSRTYLNSTQERQNLIDFCLTAYALAISQRLSMGDVTVRGQVVRHDYSDFLRADPLTRMQIAETGIRIGVTTRDEVRQSERKPSLPEDVTPVTPAPAASQTETAATFDVHPDLELTFGGIDPVAAAAQFRVDVAKRTITGLMVPYGSAAQSMGRFWQFSKGSLAWGDPSRVKLLVGHDPDKAVGYATEIEDTDAGLVGTFKVARGDAGDEALVMAEDKVWDGLSVGIGLGGEYEEKDGVLHAVKAPLTETSLTPFPAFDDARVREVAASKTKEIDVTETVNTPTEQPSVTFSKDELVAAFAEAIKLGMAPQGDGPQVIAPRLSVKEPLPYRFDGLRGEHEFSSDIFAMARQDAGSGEAATRVNKFMADAFTGPQFVATTDVNEVNPSQTRSDLFVDKLSYVTPVWDAINKGGLSDGTPFIVPAWASESNLVGDHTEGSSPTNAGTYVTTSMTVTPAAISGKYAVNREVVDAGGNPQVSGLIWRSVLRAYNEHLEAKAVALLDGLTPTAIALTTADATPGTEMEAAFASLQFVRGGDRFDKLVLHEDLYKALIAQVDLDGRKTYPIINPVNTNGQVAPGFASINIGGKVGLPAWALGPSGIVSESSYLFSSEDVHGWATAPQSLRFEYRVEAVDFGVWGYQATANTRLAGVREITYDPVV